MGSGKTPGSKKYQTKEARELVRKRAKHRKKIKKSKEDQKKQLKQKKIGD